MATLHSLKAAPLLFISCLVMVFFHSSELMAQQHYQDDIKLMSEHDFSKHINIHTKRSFFFISEKKFYKYNPLSLTFGGLMYLYQNIVAEQIAADCPYEVSCSGFGREAIIRFGLLKGTALAADRITRCSRLAYKDLTIIDFNKNDKIIDSPIEYKWKND